MFVVSFSLTVKVYVFNYDRHKCMCLGTLHPVRLPLIAEEGEEEGRTGGGEGRELKEGEGGDK